MTKENKILIAVVAFVVLLVGTLTYVEISTRTTEDFYVTITAKSFVPADSGTSVGIRPDGKGTQINHWSTSEKWIVLFEFRGNLFDDDVRKELWVQVEEGSEVIVRVPTSYFGEGKPYVLGVSDR